MAPQPPTCICWPCQNASGQFSQCTQRRYSFQTNRQHLQLRLTIRQYCQVYLRSFLLCGVFIPKYMTIFLQTRIYMHTKKCYKQWCAYGVTESHRIRGTESYCQPKTPSCTMKLKSNFSLNQARPQWLCYFRTRFGLIHCPHRSGGCWLPDNGFLGIRGFLLRDCVCYFTNADQKDLENSESGPAMDKECLKCGKRNHFIAKCKSKGVREAGLDDRESNEMYQTDVAAVNNWPAWFTTMNRSSPKA